MGGALPDRLLVVDLDGGRIESVSLPDRWVADFLGGKGIGARYLYEHVGPTTEPTDPENVLLCLVGPLTGYLPGGGHATVITKSPLTGLFLDSYIGGTLGSSFRATYPDHVGMAIRGAADDFQALELRSDPARLTDATELAGAETDVVDERYDDAVVACIGPAGEAGVRYATIATHGGDHHAGRGGAGAVLGSKQLKAIILPEHAELPPANATVKRLQADAAARWDTSAYGDAFEAAGTLETLAFANTAGMLPTEGWRARRFPGSDGLGLDAVQAAAVGRERSGGPPAGDYRVQPEAEYETVIRGGTPIALGSGLGIDDFDAVALLGAQCDRLGIDVISAGNAVAVAIAAADRGHIDRDISFGDPAAVSELLAEIATRSSTLGETLADGVEAAAQTLGVAEVIPAVKAMAAPSFDPRGAPAMALAFATSDRGACHRRAVPATVEAFHPAWTPTQIAARLVAEQDRRSVLWSLIADDRMAPLLPDAGAEWLAALGADRSPQTLRTLGARIWTLTRLYNVREGVSRPDDRLPAAFTEPTADGSPGLAPDRFERMLDRYYERREWDRHGRPSRRLLERLDLIDVVDEWTPVGGHPLHDQGASS